jgi:hypothetical protein
MMHGPLNVKIKLSIINNWTCTMDRTEPFCVPRPIMNYIHKRGRFIELMNCGAGMNLFSRRLLPA